MQYTAAFLGLVAAAASAVSAAPLDARTVSALADVPQWTIQSFTRTCNAADTSCQVSFAVNTGTGPATACAYTVVGSPASQASTSGIGCGPYTVSSGWSGQFGPGNGFTTWAVVDWSKKQIVYPAYTDTELKNGVAVTPDKSYPVHNL